MTEEQEIIKLNEYSHARRKTEMYLGSRNLHTQTVINWNGKELVAQDTTWTPAAYCAFREIFDNALDEVTGHGFGTKIDITYDPETLSFSVADDGRGISIAWDESERMHKATMALTQARTGRNFGQRQEVRGTNGIGSSIVVNCSSAFEVEIKRDDKKFHQKFTEGNDILPELKIYDPKITKYSSAHTGTSIHFTLSSIVFPNAKIPLEFVKSRIFEVAANHPKIKFTFNGHKVNVGKTASKTLFADREVITIDVAAEKFNSQYILVPNFAPTGEYLHSTVNDIPAFNGGQHIDTFKKLFFSGLIRSLERESKKRGLTPNRSDISDGMLIYNVTFMHSPDFDSQSKSRLINDEVDIYIKQSLEDENTFKTLIKQHKEWIDSVYERCAARTQKKDDAEVAKASRKLLRTKVPKLMDAIGKDRSKCILMICEGDSAISSSSAVRNPEIHGGLPLRGKIMNVRGESTKDIMDNAIIQDIMSSIGIGLNQRVDRKQLRYGQVWLTCDADTDGANIMALLVNFFYLQWPELFDPAQPPFFLVFSTPFIIQEDKKKVRHYWYDTDWLNYNPDDWKGCPHPTRAKGLGSLEEIDWANSMTNPRLIPITDDGKLAETLDLIFNNKRADDRKKWMGLN